MAETQTFEVVILGGGPGGYAAALYGAAAGLNIALVEEADIGVRVCTADVSRQKHCSRLQK